MRIEEAAQKMGVTRSWVESLCKEGSLEYDIVCGQPRPLEESVDRYLANKYSSLRVPEDEIKRRKREYARLYRERNPRPKAERKMKHSRESRAEWEERMGYVQNAWEIWRRGSVSQSRAPNVVAVLHTGFKAQAKAYFSEKYNDDQYFLEPLDGLKLNCLDYCYPVDVVNLKEYDDHRTSTK